MIGEDTDGTDGWAMDWTDIPSDLDGSIVEILARAIDDDDAAATDASHVEIRGYAPSRR